MALVAGTQTAQAWSAPITRNDYGGDGKSEIAVWRPSNGTWYWLDSNTGASWNHQFGLPGDVPVSADYSYGLTPDGKSDRAVFRPSNATWYWYDSQNGNAWSMAFGLQGDTPVAGDFDGDGRSDIAVWRHSKSPGYVAGTWFVLKSSTWSTATTQWGLEGDIPVTCDYDNDGKSDYAVFRPSNSNWYVINSSTGAGWNQLWGQTGDVPVPGDYDADGKCDLAIWRPGTATWWILKSSTGTSTTTWWGLTGDRPAPTDHDGDGKTDLIVWRPSNGTWYGINSTNGANWNTVLGTGGANGGGISSDVPLPNLPGNKNLLANVLSPQQQSNWCWAATTQMTAAYYGFSVSQCAEANYYHGRTDCCSSSSAAANMSQCNQGGWWTLSRHGFTMTDLWSSAISFAQLSTEIQAGRPVPFAWAWTGGGGHAMVAISTWTTTAGAQWVTINDPWAPNVGAQTDLLYSNWVSVTNNYTHWRDSYNVVRN